MATSQENLEQFLNSFYENQDAVNESIDGFIANSVPDRPSHQTDTGLSLSRMAVKTPDSQPITIVPANVLLEVSSPRQA